MEDDEEELDFVLDELDNLLLFCRPITVVWRKRENKISHSTCSRNKRRNKRNNSESNVEFNAQITNTFNLEDSGSVE